MRQMKSQFASDASPLEEMYNQLFRTNAPPPVRFDQRAFPNTSLVPTTHLKYVTYVTYGACEDPLLAR
jgi:hypothetical protein